MRELPLWLVPPANLLTFSLSGRVLLVPFHYTEQQCRALLSLLSGRVRNVAHYLWLRGATFETALTHRMDASDSLVLLYWRDKREPLPALLDRAKALSARHLCVRYPSEQIESFGWIERDVKVPLFQEVANALPTSKALRSFGVERLDVGKIALRTGDPLLFLELLEDTLTHRQRIVDAGTDAEAWERSTEFASIKALSKRMNRLQAKHRNAVLDALQQAAQKEEIPQSKVTERAASVGLGLHTDREFRAERLTRVLLNKQSRELVHELSGAATASKDSKELLETLLTLSARALSWAVLEPWLFWSDLSALFPMDELVAPLMEQEPELAKQVREATLRLLSLERWNELVGADLSFLLPIEQKLERLSSNTSLLGRTARFCDQLLYFLSQPHELNADAGITTQFVFDSLEEESRWELLETLLRIAVIRSAARSRRKKRSVISASWMAELIERARNHGGTYRDYCAVLQSWSLMQNSPAFQAKTFPKENPSHLLEVAAQFSVEDSLREMRSLATSDGVDFGMSAGASWWCWMFGMFDVAPRDASAFGRIGAWWGFECTLLLRAIRERDEEFCLGSLQRIREQLPPHAEPAQFLLEALFEWSRGDRETAVSLLKIAQHRFRTAGAIGTADKIDPMLEVATS